MTLARGARALLAVSLLLPTFGTEAAPPPSRRSKAFDDQPAVYGARGAFEAPDGSRLPWPITGSWLVRPLRVAPEIDPILADRPPPLEHAAPALRQGLVPPADIPLPPRRPTSLGGIAPLAADSQGFAAGGSCFAQLKAAGIAFTPAEQPSTGNPGCGIDNPVRVTAIAERGAPGGTVSLPDQPVISCRMAVKFGEYVRAVAPGLGQARNAALSSITTGPGWECRGRNRQRGAKLSAHSNGDALDINTFFFANRARIPVQGSGRDPAFHAARMAACSYFTTVLGPGTAFHDGHLHLDIMNHRAGYRMCR